MLHSYNTIMFNYNNFKMSVGVILNEKRIFFFYCFDKFVGEYVDGTVIPVIVICRL